MTSFSRLNGVYAAALTPVLPNGSPALNDVPVLLDFLARRGCQGALLLGTTGEGPSFAPEERQALLKAAVQVRQQHPEMRLLAGTGTPSLEETIALTRQAFDLGLDGVVVLPPYYFRNVTDEGLFAWFSQVLERAVPEGGALLGYHIPSLTGVPLSFGLLEQLRDAFPDRFAGLKDSSANPEHARQLGDRFGQELLILNGNDALFELALHNQASGCITALANLFSSDLRRLWDAYQRGEVDGLARERLLSFRAVLDRNPPAPPFLKAMISRLYGLPRWAVRPPLLPLAAEKEDSLLGELQSAAVDLQEEL